MINSDLLKRGLLTRDSYSHKGDYGHLLLLCGNESMPGAAVLATGAALKSGCGLVTLHSTPRALLAAVTVCPSAILSENAGSCITMVPTDLSKYSAIGIGPGIGREPATQNAVHRLLEQANEARIPMLIDADALNILSLHKDWLNEIPSGSVMTPHDGELRRLTDWNGVDARELAAKELCERTGCVVVMKGFGSQVLTPTGVKYTNTTGNAGLAKGGSGDVLSGLLSGLMARGYDAATASAMAVWIHGYAADCLTSKCTAEAYNSNDLINSIFKGFSRLYSI
ncbi:MAG: NAD(P)H-hydrate dehydratase [Bacteroidales bacterium]|nr:NAD(P)H-hydrate dehydratase [Bacteroidales bacterium]